jgi:hypothetical protein
MLTRDGTSSQGEVVVVLLQIFTLPALKQGRGAALGKLGTVLNQRLTKPEEPVKGYERPVC